MRTKLIYGVFIALFTVGIFASVAVAQSPPTGGDVWPVCSGVFPERGNPCVDEDGAIVELQVVQTPIPASAGMDEGWTILAEGSAEECFSNVSAQSGLTARAAYYADGTLQDESMADRSVSVSGSGCVRVEMRISARGATAIDE